MEELVSLFLKEEYHKVEELRDRYLKAIESREIPLEKLAKSETLIDSPENYQKKMASGNGRRSASYELALASSRDYRRGDQVSYYITGDKKRVAVVDSSCLLADAPEHRNDNVAYYMNKLEELYKKFSDFIPSDFNQGTLF
jgi:DNA polymerase elongation subunit (family B)